MSKAFALITLLIIPLAATASSAMSLPREEIVFASTYAVNARDADIFVVDRRGRRVNLTRTPGVDETQPDISPDGRSIVFTRGFPFPNLYAMRIDGKQVRQLTTDPADEGEPVWSPDGTSVAFSRTNDEARIRRDVWVTKADGSSEWKVAQGGTPSWSPDGRRLSIVRSDGIYVVNRDGTGLRRVVALRDYLGNPVWLNRSSIVFPHENTRGPGLFTANTEGGTLRRIRNPCRKKPGGSGPIWSPDRKHIACVQAGRGSNSDTGLVYPPGVVFRTRAGARLAVVSLSPANQYAFFGGVSLAPSGTKFAYGLYIDVKNADLRIVSAGGGDTRPLFTGPTEDHDPSWAPGGQRIVFVQNTRYQNRYGGGRLMVLDVRRRRIRPLRPRLVGATPAWSPDGRWIAFAAQPAPLARHSNLFVVTSGGTSKPRLLTKGALPAWSPDGKQLAYVREKRIYTIGIRGGSERLVIALQDFPHEISWSPARPELALSTRHAIEVVNLAEPQAQTIVRDDANPLSSPTWSPDGETIAYASGWESDIPHSYQEPDAHYLQIRAVNREGTGHRLVVANAAFNFDPDWKR